jgi:hypothetical protein
MCFSRRFRLLCILPSPPGSKTLSIIQHLQEMTDRSRQAIECPDNNHVEPAAACIPHQFIETGPLGLGPADSVCVLVNDLIPALAGQFPEVVQLAFRVLLIGRDSHVKGARYMNISPEAAGGARIAARWKCMTAPSSRNRPESARYGFSGFILTCLRYGVND